MKSRPCSSPRAGFTLIEILVVISIISLLSSVVLASVNTVQAAGRDGRRNEDLVQFRNALELYAASHNGQYPATPTNIALTSMGPVSVGTGAVPVCPSNGNSWTSYDTNNYGAGFVSALQPYYSQLPTDPENNSSHCYIYRSSPQVQTGAWNSSDTATSSAVYDSSFESGVLAQSVVGAVEGGDNTTYAADDGVPTFNDIIGVTPTVGSQGPMCTGTPSCSQFTPQVVSGNTGPCVTAFSSSPNTICEVDYGGEFNPPGFTNSCVAVPNACQTMGVAACNTYNARYPGMGCVVH